MLFYAVEDDEGEEEGERGGGEEEGEGVSGTLLVEGWKGGGETVYSTFLSVLGPFGAFWSEGMIDENAFDSTFVMYIA